MADIRDLSLEYMAGIVDGEGCISVGHAVAGRTVRVRVRISNTSLKLMVLIAAQFGGSISTDKRRGDSRQQYEWCLWNNNAVEFIKKIRPWMIIKAKQADIVIALDRTNIEAIVEAKEAVSMLNHRGSTA